LWEGYHAPRQGTLPGHYQKLWLAGDETDFLKGVIDEYYRMGLRP